MVGCNDILCLQRRHLTFNYDSPHLDSLSLSRPYGAGIIIYYNIQSPLTQHAARLRYNRLFLYNLYIGLTFQYVIRSQDESLSPIDTFQNLCLLNIDQLGWFCNMSSKRLFRKFPKILLSKNTQCS